MEKDRRNAYDEGRSLPEQMNPIMLISLTMLFLLLLQTTGGTYPSMPTGLEWMVIASVLVPAVLLVVLVYLGGKNTVRR